MSFQSRELIQTVPAVAVSLILSVACHAPQSSLPGGRGVIADDPAATAVASPPEVRFAREVRPARTVIRLDEDGYALVVDVAPDGRVQVLHPASAEESAFLHRDSAYVLPDSLLARWGHSPFTTSQTRLKTTRIVPGRGQSGGVRGPGYVFVLASRTSFRVADLARAGFFTGDYVGSSIGELDPGALIPEVARAAVGDSAAARSDLFRYAGYIRDAGVPAAENSDLKRYDHRRVLGEVGRSTPKSHP